MMKNNPAAPALVNTVNVITLPGAAAIKLGDEIVAALGVGGSPGGEKDDACANAGVAAIASQSQAVGPPFLLRQVHKTRTMPRSGSESWL